MGRELNNKYILKEEKNMSNTVVAMNSEERRTEQFNIIMANVMPMMTKGKGKTLHTITGSACVPLTLCYVDERYQGMRSHKNIKRLENNWDERKLSPIILVPHPEEHRFAIVDGQGRYIVAPKKGLDKLHSIILMDARLLRLKDREKNLYSVVIQIHIQLQRYMEKNVWILFFLLLQMLDGIKRPMDTQHL